VQRLFDELTDRLSAFVAQRDDLALLLACRDEEGVIVDKALEALDDRSPSDIYWRATARFDDADSWVDGVLATTRSTIDAVRHAQRAAGDPSWPAEPDGLDLGPPAARLRALIAFTRDCLPEPDGMTAVWCLLPLEVADPVAWSQLMTAVLAHEFPRPWCHHLRFLVRDTPAPPTLAALHDQPRIVRHAIEFSMATAAAEMEREIDDESLPLERRLQTLFVQANLDHANNRASDAIAKYDLLLRHYTNTGNATMAALTLNALGEVYQRAGDSIRAQEMFALAWQPAAAASPPPIPILLNISLNLGNLHFARGEWAEAEGCLDAAQQLATAQRAPRTKMEVLERLGHARYQQGNVDGALACWSAGATVSRELALPDIEAAHTTTLRSYYSAVGDVTRVRELDARLEQLTQAPRA
jgi:tetratricopeptide (TPR) repeat protein